MPLPLQQPPGELCIIRLSAIGDCCHVLPVARTIQSAWPATRITWIIGRTEHGLLHGAAGIEFITFDKRQPWRSLVRIRRQLAGRRFPVLLHMHASMRANLVSLQVNADMRLGFDRARARDRQWLFTNARIAARPSQHVMDGMFGFTEALGITTRTLRWDFAIGEGERRFAAGVAAGRRPMCIISPCSSQRFRNWRNWRMAHYVAVARHLAATHGASIVITGGNTAVEHEYGQAIAHAVGAAATNLVGQTTLKQLYALIEAADMVICPDSGPAHMATAAGTPVVGLYATSNRWRTGPYLSQDLVVDAYPQAVLREFGQPPEGLRWGQRVRHPDAMDLITPQEVIRRAENALQGGRRPALT